jgi:acyl carrier protein
MEELIRTIFREDLGKDEIDPNASIYEQLDSFQVITLLLAVQTRLGISMEMDDLPFGSLKFADFCEKVESLVKKRA